MESTDLDMGEIFDDDGNDDDDIGALGALPDLEDTQPQDNEDEENAEVLARLKDLSKGASKKIVRKPQPKLDPSRLTGDRGIPVLPKLFENTKFKGKGHEAQDLAVIMRQMEHWAHRLFPKMPFDEVIERVEKLGGKKEVQTCVKKIRLDMPILDADFVGSEPEDDVIRNGDDVDEPPAANRNPDDVWDELLRDEAELTASQVQDNEQTSEERSRSETVIESSPSNNTHTTSASQSNNTSGGMTPAQMERMERNKQLALERRLKKLGKFTPGKSPLPSQQSPKTNQSQETQQTQSRDQTHDEDTNPKTTDNAKTNEIGSLSQESKQSNELENSTEPNESKGINSDDEMSEVLEKGPSLSINLVDKFAKNAQNWNTEANETNTAGITESVDNTEDTEAMDVDTDEVLEKLESGVDCKDSANTDEMSEVNEKHEERDKLTNVDKIDNERNVTNVNDSEEMSEVIPIQTEGVLDEKISDNDILESEKMSEVIENQNDS